MPRTLGRQRRRGLGHPRQRRFEDHRGRTIPAKKRAAYLKDAPKGDLAGAFYAAMKSRGWLTGWDKPRKQSARSALERLARGEITYLEACAVAPYASEDTKRKWRKVARA